jgi:phenylpyruvate tautomerase PptA (4-oxalocrotonate tautomerase family)
MPLYTVTTQAGSLSGDAKIELGGKLTALHCEMSGVPKIWVHVVFHEYPAGSGFTAGEPAAAVALTLLIRAGRSSEYKRELLKRLWDLLQSATGAPDDQIIIGIQEVPPSKATEMGQIIARRRKTLSRARVTASGDGGTGRGSVQESQCPPRRRRRDKPLRPLREPATRKISAAPPPC